jgi:hypothetical protein
LPHYFFDLFSSTGFVEDEEGAELPDREAARLRALSEIRSIVSEEARGGRVDLRGHIEVRAESEPVSIIRFVEAVELLVGETPAST